MAQEEFLDLARIHVLAAADQHVLSSARRCCSSRKHRRWRGHRCALRSPATEYAARRRAPRGRGSGSSAGAPPTPTGAQAGRGRAGPARYPERRGKPGRGGRSSRLALSQCRGSDRRFTFVPRRNGRDGHAMLDASHRAHPMYPRFEECSPLTLRTAKVQRPPARGPGYGRFGSERSATRAWPRRSPGSGFAAPELNRR